MKTATAIFLGFVLFFSKTAQSQITNEYHTVLVTNWVKPGPYLRVVDGVTYNVAYSEKWNTFSKWEALMTDLPDMNDIAGGYPGTIMRVPHLKNTIGNASIFEIDTAKPNYDAPTGQMSTDETFFKSVVVLNFTNALGKGVNFYCMRVNDYFDKNGNNFICYDCGVQATNLVPVVKNVNSPSP